MKSESANEKMPRRAIKSPISIVDPDPEILLLSSSIIASKTTPVRHIIEPKI